MVTAHLVIEHDGHPIASLDLTLTNTLDATGIAHAIQHAITDATHPAPAIARTHPKRTDPILAA